jgi:hypothetical protein
MLLLPSEFLAKISSMEIPLSPRQVLSPRLTLFIRVKRKSMPLSFVVSGGDAAAAAGDAAGVLVGLFLVGAASPHDTSWVFKAFVSR